MRYDYDVLNIGCGNNIMCNAINLDREKRQGVDVVWNLNDLPLPFKEKSFKIIYASHIIEHIIDPYGLVVDLTRILKIDGKIIVKLPTSRRSDLAHLRNGHTRNYFNCLTKNNIGFDSKPLFKNIEVKGNKIDLGRTWFNLREWIFNNIYQEIEYRLYK